MRNLKKRPPFYRRHWFLVLLIVLMVVACTGAVVAYSLHLYWLDKAAKLDMSELGKMESASTIYDRNGATIGYIYEEKREPISIAQMPLDLQHAVVSAEDNRFYTHNGSDFRGMLRAFLKNLRSNRIRQGASTITQQLARNTFTDELKGRTFSRKILEIYVARRIETTLTKDQIMEYYLDRIYLGGGLYGVEAASKGYFGKPARDLTLGEAATLAGLIKSPNNLSPWQHKDAAKGARDFVLGRMEEEGYISREQCQAAEDLDLAVKPRVLASSDSYAMEAIRQQVIAQVGLDRAVGDGLHIYTTLDAGVQKTAEDALREQLDQIERNPSFQNHPTYAQYTAKFQEEEKRAALAAQDPAATPTNIHANLPAPDYLQGALIVLGNKDGSVVALVGGRDFKHSEFNRALSPKARRPAGTAFVPFVYAAAYQKGIFPGRLFLDQLMDNRQVMVGGEAGILGEWGVERVDNHYDGPIPSALALLEGKNAATVRVGNETGLDNVIALAKRAGINSPLRDFPATFLGGSEIALSELALAYTGFPNGGWRSVAPVLLKKIEDADGVVIYEAPKPSADTRQRIIDEAPAYQVHAILAQNMKAIAVAQAGRVALKPMVAGGKSGTTYNFADALFAGYNSEVTCAVWTGFDKTSMIYRGAFGSDLAYPVWAKVMNAASSAMLPKPIPLPTTLKRVDICTRSGELATERCYDTVNGERHRTTMTIYTTAAEMPRQTCQLHTNGRASAATMVALPTPPPAPTNGTTAPKAELAVDLSNVKPVQIKEPTVIGENGQRDPYEVIQPMTAAGNQPPPANGAGQAVTGKAPGVDAAGSPAASASATPAPEREVRRATAVQPAAQDTAAAPVKVEPPPPIEFN